MLVFGKCRPALWCQLSNETISLYSAFAVTNTLVTVSGKNCQIQLTAGADEHPYRFSSSGLECGDTNVCFLPEIVTWVDNSQILTSGKSSFIANGFLSSSHAESVSKCKWNM